MKSIELKSDQAIRTQIASINTTLGCGVGDGGRRMLEDLRDELRDELKRRLELPKVNPIDEFEARNNWLRGQLFALAESMDKHAKKCEAEEKRLGGASAHYNEEVAQWHGAGGMAASCALKIRQILTGEEVKDPPCDPLTDEELVVLADGELEDEDDDPEFFAKVRSMATELIKRRNRR